MKFTERNDKRGRMLLFAGLLSTSLLPYLLHTLVLVTTQKSLGDFTYGFCNFLGLVVFVALGYLAVGNMGFTKIKDYISCGSCILLAAVFSKFAESFAYDIIGKAVNMPWILVIIAMALVVILLFVAALGLCNGFRKISVLGMVMLLEAGLLAVDWGITKLLGLASSFIKVSFATNVMIMVLLAAAETLCLYGILLYIRKKGGWERKEYSLVKRNVPVWAITLVLLVVLGVQQFMEKPEDTIFVDLQNELALGDLELMDENLEKAAEHYKRVMNRIEAWKYAVDEDYDEEVVEKAIRENKDLQIKLIYWEKEEKLKEVRDYILFEEMYLPLAIRYLNMVQEFDEEESEEYEYNDAICKDIMRLMIARNEFRDLLISVEAIEDREDEIVDGLEDYEIADATYDVITLMSQTGKSGTVTERDVNQMLDYADKNKDNLFIQRMAVFYGNALKDDRGNHYERTINAAKRYAKLFEDMDNVTEEDIKQCHMQVAQWVIELRDYNTALSYLEKIMKEDEENINAVLLAARCYSQLGNPEKCREMAQILLEHEADNTAALFYCAYTSLVEGDLETSLDYTTKICDVMVASEGEKKQDAEICLYSMLQYLTIRDNSGGYHLQSFTKFSEEQRAAIAENKVLNDYMLAVHYCFYERDFEEALTHINAVLAEEGNMAQALYLQGAIYFGMEEFEKSIDSYKASLAIETESPTAWYALANAYDALERYEEAYEAATQVKRLLPTTDHEFDMFGVGIHNTWLMERLEDAMRR
ncbi:MAG: tetratricopeptide repeat protein [Lachnospiraceae bacterium]|nr:tetratricopeptide repeat protein [Lachnospiraceae bacterium]